MSVLDLDGGKKEMKIICNSCRKEIIWKDNGPDMAFMLELHETDAEKITGEITGAIKYIKEKYADKLRDPSAQLAMQIYIYKGI